jgi:hypothetical protein
MVTVMAMRIRSQELELELVLLHLQPASLQVQHRVVVLALEVLPVRSQQTRSC